MINGNFKFVQQDNFSAYLTALGMKPLAVKALQHSAPNISIEHNGPHIAIKVITHQERRTINLVLEQEYTSRSFVTVGEPSQTYFSQYYTRLEANTLITQELNDPSSLIVLIINETDMTMVLAKSGISAKRQFSRL